MSTASTAVQDQQQQQPAAAATDSTPAAAAAPAQAPVPAGGAGADVSDLEGASDVEAAAEVAATLAKEAMAESQVQDSKCLQDTQESGRIPLNGEGWHRVMFSCCRTLTGLLFSMTDSSDQHRGVVMLTSLHDYYFELYLWPTVHCSLLLLYNVMPSFQCNVSKHVLSGYMRCCVMVSINYATASTVALQRMCSPSNFDVVVLLFSTLKATTHVRLSSCDVMHKNDL